ncbi:MAG: TIGR01777 family oxidoreductase [Crocinitomicaceae bacterium]|nr:TIGR01777 family oxidoreductase [Crocinitomicaceae bacterium]
MSRILITGGSGLIGKALTKALLDKGYSVRILSRSKKTDTDRIDYKTWNIEQGILEEGTLDGVEHIIHLAGANVADKRWSDAYKKVMHDSRVKSAELLLNNLPENHGIKSFITASGINYYGTPTSENIYSETDPAGSDYLAQLTVAWEAVADKFNGRVVKLRTPVVLSTKGGALPKIAKPVKMGIGSPLGSGKQYVPWVHMNDLVKAYLFALENDITGPFNVVADEHLSNADFTKKIATHLGKKLWAPKVPAFVLNLILGSERAQIVLEGSRANGELIKSKGFVYDHPILDLKDFEWG